MSSKHLVPGDIVEITNQLALPCDIVLLQGQAVLNESMLTGESVPVVKYPVDITPPSNTTIKSEHDDNDDSDSGWADDGRTYSRSHSKHTKDDENSRGVEMKKTVSGVGAVMVGVGTYIDHPNSHPSTSSLSLNGRPAAITMAKRVMKPIGNDQRSTLYAATKVVQLKPAIGKKQVIGMVVRTAFATQKGSLILSILFPKPSTFKFVQQSFKFTAALFIVALCGLCLSIWQLLRLDTEVSQIVVRGLDLITIVVPPALPLAMTVGANFAMRQLKKQNVFCISPPRINMAGKIKMV